MEETGTRDSAVFPPGYGDFALESSDGLICHFPRHLLAYMSETFRDIFSLPAGDGKEGHSKEPQAPLKVTEPAQTLELFLQNIDPKQPTPPVNPSTIVPLLEAAQKYQAPTITKWFEAEAMVTVKYENTPQRPKIEPFTATHPILTLYCAVHFNLPTIGQLALQEFATCPISRTLPTKAYFEIASYLEGNRLRERRSAYFDRIIQVLANPANVPLGYNRAICLQCTHTLVSWVVGIERTVRNEPSLHAFMRAYETCPSSCHKCNTSKWSDFFREQLFTWEAKAKTAESLLPAWPF